MNGCYSKTDSSIKLIDKKSHDIEEQNTGCFACFDGIRSLFNRTNSNTNKAEKDRLMESQKKSKRLLAKQADTIITQLLQDRQISQVDKKKLNNINDKDLTFNELKEKHGLKGANEFLYKNCIGMTNNIKFVLLIHNHLTINQLSQINFKQVMEFSINKQLSFNEAKANRIWKNNKMDYDSECHKSDIKKYKENKRKYYSEANPSFRPAEHIALQKNLLYRHYLIRLSKDSRYSNFHTKQFDAVSSLMRFIKGMTLFDAAAIALQRGSLQVTYFCDAGFFREKKDLDKTSNDSLSFKELIEKYGKDNANIIIKKECKNFEKFAFKAFIQNKATIKQLNQLNKVEVSLMLGKNWTFDQALGAAPNWEKIKPDLFEEDRKKFDKIKKTKGIKEIPGFSVSENLALNDDRLTKEEIKEIKRLSQVKGHPPLTFEMFGSIRNLYYSGCPLEKSIEEALVRGLGQINYLIQAGMYDKYKE